MTRMILVACLGFVSLGFMLSEAPEREFPLPAEVIISSGRTRELFSFGDDSSDLSPGPNSDKWLFVHVTSRRGDGHPKRTEICLASRKARTFKIVVEPEDLPMPARNLSILQSPLYAPKERAVVFTAYKALRQFGLWIAHLEGEKEVRYLGDVQDFELSTDREGADCAVAALANPDYLTRRRNVVIRLRDGLRSEIDSVELGEAAKRIRKLLPAYR